MNAEELEADIEIACPCNTCQYNYPADRQLPWKAPCPSYNKPELMCDTREAWGRWKEWTEQQLGDKIEVKIDDGSKCKHGIALSWFCPSCDQEKAEITKIEEVGDKVADPLCLANRVKKDKPKAPLPAVGAWVKFLVSEEATLVTARGTSGLSIDGKWFSLGDLDGELTCDSLPNGQPSGVWRKIGGA